MRPSTPPGGAPPPLPPVAREASDESAAVGMVRGLAVDRDVDVEPHVSGERFCSLALGLLDVLTDCA